MKKYMLALFVSLIFIPAYSGTNSNQMKSENKGLNAAQELRVHELMLRVDEINAMDRSQLTRSEKRDLRQELRSIKAELLTVGNGVYISTGALIIIILLIILL